MNQMCKSLVCVINECNIISQWEQIKMNLKKKEEKNTERTTAPKDNMCACKGDSFFFLYSIFSIFVWCMLYYIWWPFFDCSFCNASTYEYWENRNIVSYMLLPGTGQKIEKTRFIINKKIKQHLSYKCFFFSSALYLIH